jgi:nucleoside-diphosphate-sugar epimerase
MKKVLVSGASGFIGGNVIEALRNNGITPVALLRNKSRSDFIKAFSPEIMLGDISDKESLKDAVRHVDGVVHCAGLTKAASLAEYLMINTEGTKNLLEACLLHGSNIKSIVCVGSLSAYGPGKNGKPVHEDDAPSPVSDYGRSKLSGHNCARSFMRMLPVCILMPPAVYGPYDRDFLMYFKLAKSGIMPFLGREIRYASVIYVKDLAQAVLLCLLNKDSGGKAYFADDGKIHTWEGIAKVISETIGKKPLKIRMPDALARFACVSSDIFCKITGKSLILNSDRLRDFLASTWLCDSGRIQKELGFRPEYSLKDGMNETYLWYMKNKWL